MLIMMRIGDRMAEFKIRCGDGEEEILRKKEAKEEAIDEAKRYWKQRNIVFHSWRHFYAARMTDRIEARKVMLATGHTTEVVFRTYSDHVLEGDLAEVAEMTGEVFGTILSESIVHG
jgi:integrase